MKYLLLNLLFLASLAFSEEDVYLLKNARILQIGENVYGNSCIKVLLPSNNTQVLIWTDSYSPNPYIRYYPYQLYNIYVASRNVYNPLTSGRFVLRSITYSDSTTP